MSDKPSSGGDYMFLFRDGLIPGSLPDQGERPQRP